MTRELWYEIKRAVATWLVNLAMSVDPHETAWLAEHIFFHHRTRLDGPVSAEIAAAAMLADLGAEEP